MRRSAIKWWVALAVLLVLGAAIGRAVVARKAEQAAQAAAPRAVQALELATADVAPAQARELVRWLDITGALKAVNSALVKAKVAAEVRELSVREGDKVSAGQVLGRLDASEYEWRLRQAEQTAAASEAQLDIAERALENNRALVNQGFISKNALDTSVSNAAAARGSLQAARAAAGLARKARADTVLRAPIAGFVSQRLVQPGERVPVDARLIEIVDLSRLEIEAAVAPEDVGAVRLGAQARLQIDGVDAPVIASVARINPSTQAGTRAVLVYLAVQAQPGLRQGLFARGRIELDRKTALTVPASAVRIDQARPYVLAVSEGKVVQRTVTLGTRGSAVVSADAGDSLEREPLVEVTEGLADGSIVLRGSVGTVREGTVVRLGDAATARR
ncbi:efflux RND transporter periplasmic adaptor subunit [Methylibium sp.]|uniref:efflux RND transporter periplasmic adaptor subunit n=1 Tax=Methylibium sp. TaxID=2067992 RepID=UPI00286C5418|nr:efflux RND transporter periplasmic adaptor subunit [Methylibium sp.]